jgi:hypothetical protein
LIPKDRFVGARTGRRGEALAVQGAQPAHETLESIV